MSIGKTREGRDLWAVEIANPAGRPVAQRPALLIAANFEGDHLIGANWPSSSSSTLLNGYAADATIKQRLDNHVVYVIPRVNADGAEQMFAPVEAGAARTSRPTTPTTTGAWTRTAPRT